MEKSKPGFKTTEFWAMIGTVLLGVSKTVPLPPWGYPVVIVGYELSRALAKSFEKKGDQKTDVPSK